MALPNYNCLYDLTYFSQVFDAFTCILRTAAYLKKPVARGLHKKTQEPDFFISKEEKYSGFIEVVFAEKAVRAN